MGVGDLRRAYEAAMSGLASAPGDVALLRIAAEASLELGGDDAVERYRAYAAAAPRSADAHRGLGLALLAEGDSAAGADAFRAAIAIDPDDRVALISLGHVVHRGTGADSAAEMLEQVAEREPDNRSVIANLVEMHRMGGRLRRAVVWAERLVEADPDDPLALLTLAELHLDLGEHDDARAAFERLRVADAEPGRAVYAVHGMIEAEVRRGRLRTALDLAVTATAVDRNHITTDLLAYVVAQVLGPGERPAPSWEAVSAALQVERQEYRTALAEAAMA